MDYIREIPYPQEGSETGLLDSTGLPIRIGDYVRMEVTGNTEVHGSWTIKEVVARAMVPVLLYVYSEKGEVLPRGYTGCCLSDYYDPKALLWKKDESEISPCEEIIRVNKKGEIE